MAEWTIISKDVDIVTKEIQGATFAMRVPGGMIVRNIFHTGNIAMVFVPDPHNSTIAFASDDVLALWIEDNKITK